MAKINTITPSELEVYKKTEWEDNVTPISADNLNHIEKGIEAVNEAVKNIASGDKGTRWLDKNKPSYNYSEIGDAPSKVSIVQKIVERTPISGTFISDLEVDNDNKLTKTISSIPHITIKEEIAQDPSSDSFSVIQSIAHDAESDEHLSLDAKTLSLKKVAWTGSYTDLLSVPVIPDKTSQLINDSDYVTKNELKGHAEATYAAGIEGLADDGLLIKTSFFPERVTFYQYDQYNNYIGQSLFFKTTAPKTSPLMDNTWVEFVNGIYSQWGNLPVLGFAIYSPKGALLNKEGYTYRCVAESSPIRELPEVTSLDVDKTLVVSEKGKWEMKYVPTPAFGNDIKVTSDIGEIKLGEAPCVLLQSKGKTIETVLNTIMSKERQPETDIEGKPSKEYNKYPSISTTITAYDTNEKPFSDYVPYGTEIKKIKITYTYDQGKYQYGAWGGGETECELSQITVGITHGGTFIPTSFDSPAASGELTLEPSITVATDIKVEVSANYGAANKPAATNIGNKGTWYEKEIKFGHGTCDDSHIISIPICYEVKDATIIGDSINLDFVNKLKDITNDNLIDIDISEQSKSCCIAIPSSKELNQILPLNEAFLNDIKSTFSKSSLKGKDQKTIYEVYYKNFGTAYGESATYKVSLQQSQS